MRVIRLLAPVAVVAGSLGIAGIAGATTSAPVAGCVDPTTVATTVPVPTTPAAVPTTLAPGAVPFVAPEGDFVATFPAQPTVQDLGAGLGPETTAWGIIDESSAFVVTRTMLAPGETIDLRNGCEGAIAEMGATLVSSAPVTVDGHLGIELVATVDGAGVVQRIIDGGTAMYQVMVSKTGPLTAADPDVAAFFASFRLTGTPPSPATAPTIAPATVTTAAAGIPVPTVVASPTVAPGPTAAVPTVVIPTVVIPTVVIPTVVIPTISIAPPIGWTVFTSPTDGYSVALPGEPELATTPMPTADGTTLPLSSARVDAGDRAWVVNHFAVPAGGNFDVEAGRDGSLGDFSATLVSSVPIELDGRTGLEFVGSFTQSGEPATVVSRIYTDGTRVHQLIALAFGTIDATDTEVAAFFASFTFTGAAP